MSKESSVQLSPHLGFYHVRTTLGILEEGFRLYYKHGVTLTKPLLMPILLQCAGIGLWIGLAYGVSNGLPRLFPDINPWLLFGLFALANLPGPYLFFKGFWEYLVWVSGLNMVVRDLTEVNSTASLSSAYLRINSRSFDYTLLWLFLFGLFFVPLCLGVALVNGLSWLFPSAAMWWIGLSFMVMGVGCLVALFVNILVSLAFQSFAFSPSSAGSTLFRSADLVCHGFVKTLVVGTMTFACVMWVIPTLLVSVLEFTPWISQLSSMLAASIDNSLMASYGVNYSNVMDSNQTAGQMIGLTQHLSGITFSLDRICYYGIELTLYSIFSALLLPLGTCWFALLYADLKTRMAQRVSLPGHSSVISPPVIANEPTI